jgi:hypothetical protein
MGWLRELVEYQIVQCIPAAEQDVKGRCDVYHSGKVKSVGDKSIFLIIDDKIVSIAESEIPDYEVNYKLIRSALRKMPTIMKK